MKKLSLLSDNSSISLSRTRVTFQDNGLSASDLQSSRFTQQLSPIKHIKPSLGGQNQKTDSFCEKQTTAPQNFLQSLNQQIRLQEKKRAPPPISAQIVIDREEAKKQQSQIKLGKELVSRLELLMNYDDERSTILDASRFSNEYLNINQPLIPCLVQSIHASIIQNLDQVENPFLNAGILPNLGFSYFVINNVVYFQDLERCARMLPLNPPTKTLFKDKVLQIVEGKFKSAALRAQECRQLLIVSHPGQICLYRYSINQRQLQVFHLGISVKTSTDIRHIVSTKEGRIFYVEGQGKLVQITQDIVSKWVRPFSTKRFYLHNRKHNGGNSYLCALQKLKKQSLSEAIGYFSNVTKKTFQCIYNTIRRRSDMKILSLVVNNDAKMISILRDKGWQVELECFSFAANKLESLIAYNEKQIFTNIDQKEYLREYKLIYKAFSISPAYDPKSNLVLLLKNGARIFLNVARNSVKQTRTIYSPRVQKYTATELTHPYEPIVLPATKRSQIQITKSTSKDDITLMTFEQPSGSKEQIFLIDKMPLYSYETITKIQWQIALKQEQFSYTGQLEDTHLLTEQLRTMFELGGEVLNKDSKCFSLNELTREVYFPPRAFYFMNSIGIEFKLKMRPIDVIFNLVFHQQIPLNYCSKVFISMVQAGFAHPSEIGSILMQLLLDKSGEYYVQNSFAEKLIALSDIHSHKQSLFIRVDEMNSKTIRVPYSQISRPVINRIAELAKDLERMFAYPKSIFQQIIERSETPIYSEDKYYHQSKNAREQGMILYLSRLIRPIWHVRLDHLSLKTGSLKPLLEILESVHKQLVHNPIGLFSEAKLSYRINQTLLDFVRRAFQLIEISRILPSMPQIPFCEALFQTPLYFQKYIFNSLVKGFKVENLIAGTLRIPSFTSIRIKKLVQYYQEFQRLSDLGEIMQKVDKYKKIPSYVHQYLIEYKNFPKHKKVAHDDQLISQKPKHLWLTMKINQLLEEVEELKKQIPKSRDPKELEESLETKVQNIRILKLQSAILQEHLQRRIQVSAQVFRGLQQGEYMYGQIRALVHSLNSGFLDALFMTNFNVIEPKIIHTLVQDECRISKQKGMSTLKRLVQSTYDFEQIDSLTKVVIEVLSVALGEEKKPLRYIGSILDGKQIYLKETEVYSMGMTLLSWGYTIQHVCRGFKNSLQAFPQQIKKQSYRQRPIAQTFYLLMCYLVFVKQAKTSETGEAENMAKMVVDCVFTNEIITADHHTKFVEYIESLCKKEIL